MISACACCSASLACRLISVTCSSLHDVIWWHPAGHFAKHDPGARAVHASLWTRLPVVCTLLIQSLFDEQVTFVYS